MGLMTLETYVPGRSPIHGWEPRQKLFSLMALMFALAMVQQAWLMVPMVSVTVLLYWLSGLPLSFFTATVELPRFIYSHSGYSPPLCQWGNSAGAVGLAHHSSGRIDGYGAHCGKVFLHSYPGFYSLWHHSFFNHG